MPSVTIYPGDNRLTLDTIIDLGQRVHAVVTDPPYGLKFMGKSWDDAGIERDPAFWKLIYDILLPGGYCFAFSGSRTGHWQAVAMEQAGFIMHPMHGWVYGSGFPKAHNASKAIDQLLGSERPVIGQSNNGSGAQPNKLKNHAKGDTGIGYADGSGKVFDLTAPGSPEAEKWEGWAYGTQSQKPALEPIYLGQRPYDTKTDAENLIKHGVGAVNIDGCRVPHVTVGDGSNLALNPHMRESINGGNGGRIFPTEADRRVVVPNSEGRHPSNLILDGSPDVTALFPDSSGSGPARTLKRSEKPDQQGWGMNTTAADEVALRDAGTGSAARFFHQFPPDPVIYQAKASKADRAGSTHPTVKPIALMQYLIRHITPPGGVVLDPFAGSGTTGEAALREGFDCILMEADESHVAFLRERFKGKTG